MRHSVTIALLASLVTSSGAAAQSSTFSTNDEGWRVGEFFSVGTSVGVTYVGSGGNQGGYITTTDRFGWNAFWAPSMFLGNKSALYGGTLSLDERVLSSDGNSYPMVVISDGSLRLQYVTAPPTTNWNTFLFPLTEAGWQLANGTGNPGPAATQAQFQQVLGNLAWLHIDADWQTGPDQVDLDNVIMTAAVPEPASLALLVPGLLGIAVFVRRRR